MNWANLGPQNIIINNQDNNIKQFIRFWKQSTVTFKNK